MDDVQISISDLMAAFATENAALSQRAVLAEQKAKAWRERAETLQKMLDDAAPVALPEPDPVQAVADVPAKWAPRKRAAPKPE